MDFNFQKVKDKALQLIRPKPGLHARVIATPVKDWKIILSCTALMIILAALLSGFVYLGAVSATAPSTNVQTAASRSKIDEAEIHKVLSSFDTRAVIHGQVRAGMGGLVDPSR